LFSLSTLAFRFKLGRSAKGTEIKVGDKWPIQLHS
jgi:hypothetical protein